MLGFGLISFQTRFLKLKIKGKNVLILHYGFSSQSFSACSQTDETTLLTNGVLAFNCLFIRLIYSCDFAHFSSLHFQVFLGKLPPPISVTNSNVDKNLTQIALT